MKGFGVIGVNWPAIKFNAAGIGLDQL
jgi:hypothetical protein